MIGIDMFVVGPSVSVVVRHFSWIAAFLFAMLSFATARFATNRQYTDHVPGVASSIK